MKTNNFGGLHAIAFAALAMIAMSGCGKGTANVSFGNYTAFDRVMDPIIHFLRPVLITPAYAATSNIDICVHRIRFKGVGENDAADLASDDDNDDLSQDDRVGTQGWIAVNVNGNFGTVNVPHPKQAVKAEIDVDNHCVGHPSVSFTTSAGSFSSTSSFTMVFLSLGSVDLTQAGASVSLGVQPIINALNALPSGAADSAIIAALQTPGTL